MTDDDRNRLIALLNERSCKFLLQVFADTSIIRTSDILAQLAEQEQY